MQVIDAHQHFWLYNAERDVWITDDMQTLKQNFLPADLKPLLDENNVDGCVAVQADESENETDFLLNLAKENEWIKAVVGWVNLRSEKIEERLAYYSQQKKLKGFRHILQKENIKEFVADTQFLNGISLLKKYSFTYDILVYPHQLQHIHSLIKKFPDQFFVLDHAGKPDIKNQSIYNWKQEVEKLAKHENVYCKISGLVTEADWQSWNENELHPYLDIIIKSFGVSRIMFGSDWPVCLLASSYKKWIDCINNYFDTYSSTQKQKIFGANAVAFYHIQS